MQLETIESESEAQCWNEDKQKGEGRIDISMDAEEAG